MGKDATTSNSHASALVFGTAGILIRGKSGSGKTSLLLNLLENANRACRFSALVCDDQALLDTAGDRLIVRRFDTISGLVEIRGLGIIELKSVESAVIRLVVDLVRPQEIDRLPEHLSIEINGVELPQLLVPERDQINASRMILHKLDCQNASDRR